jgi:3-dehydroquinate synthetase
VYQARIHTYLRQRRGSIEAGDCLVDAISSPVEHALWSRRGIPGPTVEGSHPLAREIQFGNVTYRYVVADGGWSALGSTLRGLNADRLFAIVDVGIPAKIVAKVSGVLGSVAPLTTLSMTPAEEHKCLSTVGDMAETLFRGGATRRSFVVAVGGGLIGNVAGLLASLMFRGIGLIHLPTTLLALSDSTLSLKQAVNGNETKNVLGTYYPPKLVWSDLEIIRPLPSASIRSALCEAAKNVLAIIPERFDEFHAMARPEADYSDAEIVDIIDLCIAAKSRVMAADPSERQAGLILEYGHTVGHAIELASGGEISHGYAIGLGMIAAAEISFSLGHLGRRDADRHLEILRGVGAPLGLSAEISRDRVLELIALDNKRGYLPATHSGIDMVLLSKLGVPVQTDGIPLRPVSFSLIERSVDVLYRG